MSEFQIIIYVLPPHIFFLRKIILWLYIFRIKNIFVLLMESKLRGWGGKRENKLQVVILLKLTANFTLVFRFLKKDQDVEKITGLLLVL